jgi:hypothetical protein
MADSTAKRDRSPAFPQVPLGEAVDRLIAFEKHFGRHAAPLDRAGTAWGLKQYGDILAALRYFGLLEYAGDSNARQVIITDEGRNLLRAQQEATKREIIRRAALRPKEIAKFWPKWGSDRPPDEVCLDELILRNGFSTRGAPLFLSSYDATISFAGLATPGKIDADLPAEANAGGGATTDARNVASPANPPPPFMKPPPASKGMTLMADERELTAGLLSKDANFRLIVSGPVGVREIERLIRKLELDKEILADETDDGEEIPIRGAATE